MIFISVRVKIIKHHGRSLGYGFVSFETKAEAEKAVKELDKKTLDGRELNIQLAVPEPSPVPSSTINQTQTSTSNTEEPSKEVKVLFFSYFLVTTRKKSLCDYAREYSTIEMD